MVRHTYIILSLALALLTTSCSFDKRDVYKVVEGCTVYEKPDATSNRVSGLRKGVEIKADKCVGDWVYTQYKHSEPGYVHIDNLKIDPYKSPKIKEAAVKKERKAKMADLPWYNLKRWGIFGWIIKWLIILPLIFGLGLFLPLSWMLHSPSFSGFICGVIGYIGGFFLVKLYTTIIHSLNIYYGNERMFIFLGALSIAYYSIFSTLKGKCPSCNHVGVDIVASRKVKHEHKEYDVHTRGPREGEKELTSSTKYTTKEYKRRCKNCGHEWW